MTDAERDPHVLVSARIGGSQKMLSLPSHRARWGWIVMLGQAKLQRPPGRFQSLMQARYLAGEFRDAVVAWLDAGLLHAAPAARECKRCSSAFTELRDDEVVVHDWRHHQERSRTTEWRDAKGVPSGHVNLSGETTGKRAGKQSGKQKGNTPPRAPTRALQSQSLSSESSPVVAREVPGAMPVNERDALDTYHELTGWRPWLQFSGDQLRGAIKEYTDATVDTALRACHAEDGDRTSLLRRTLARLAKEAERTKRDKPKPRLVTPVRDEAAFQAERRRIAEPGVTA